MMPDARNEIEDHADVPPSAGYVRRRRVHLLASWIVVGTGLAHLEVGSASGASATRNKIRSDSVAGR